MSNTSHGRLTIFSLVGGYHGEYSSVMMRMFSRAKLRLPRGDIRENVILGKRIVVP